MQVRILDTGVSFLNNRITVNGERRRGVSTKRITVYYSLNQVGFWMVFCLSSSFAAVCAAVLSGGSVLARKLLPRRDDRIGALLGAEYLLLLGAIVLPIALECRIGEDPGPGVGWIHLAVFGGLFAGTLLFFLLFHAIEICKERKYHALHHPNS